jgi:hypothetical protein
MESPSRPVTWEVKFAMAPPSPKKSPVQQRLEATLEWKSDELLAEAEAPPQLVLPTQVREAASERRRLAQDQHVRAKCAEHFDHAKRVARQIQLQRDAAATQLKNSIDSKVRPKYLFRNI